MDYINNKELGVQLHRINTIFTRRLNKVKLNQPQLTEYRARKAVKRVALSDKLTDKLMLIAVNLAKKDIARSSRLVSARLHCRISEKKA